MIYKFNKENLKTPFRGEKDACADIETLIACVNDAANGTCLEDIFGELLGSGSFKECYELNDKYVIKFITAENNSKAEATIFAAAEIAGVSEFFAESYFFELPKPIDFIELEPSSYKVFVKEDEGKSDGHWTTKYKAQKATHLMIQEKCARFEYDDYIDYQYSLNKALKDMNKEDVAAINAAVKHHINPLFIKKALETAPISQIVTFANFVRGLRLVDLRPCNLGFNSQGYPVILDPMSSHA